MLRKWSARNCRAFGRFPGISRSTRKARIFWTSSDRDRGMKSGSKHQPRIKAERLCFAGSEIAHGWITGIEQQGFFLGNDDARQPQGEIPIFPQPARAEILCEV